MPITCGGLGAVGSGDEQPLRMIAPSSIVIFFIIPPLWRPNGNSAGVGKAKPAESALSEPLHYVDESHSSDDEGGASLIYRRYKQRQRDLFLGHRRGKCDTVNRHMTDT